MPAELQIEIDAQGRVTISTKGLPGPACLDSAMLLSQVVGRIEHQQLTVEYYEQPGQVNEQLHVRQQRR